MIITMRKWCLCGMSQIYICWWASTPGYSWPHRGPQPPRVSPACRGLWQRRWRKQDRAPGSGQEVRCRRGREHVQDNVHRCQRVLLFSPHFYPNPMRKLSHTLTRTHTHSLCVSLSCTLFLSRSIPNPHDWKSDENPPYAYYVYYMYANIAILNQASLHTPLYSFLLFYLYPLLFIFYGSSFYFCLYTHALRCHCVSSCSFAKIVDWIPLLSGLTVARPALWITWVRLSVYEQ